MRSRVETAARWVLWSPTRVRGAVFMAACLAAVLVVAAVAAVMSARPASGSCEDATRQFTAAFFDAPKDAAWAQRVAQTVTPDARRGVNGIDPAGIPAGPARVTAVAEDRDRCTATVDVAGMPLAVAAVQRQGQWLVDAWGPQ